jgi:hypothetical protein
MLSQVYGVPEGLSRGRAGKSESAKSRAQGRTVEITIETNLGESRRYTFESIAAALEFLEQFDEETLLNDEDGPAIWDTQNIQEDTGPEPPGEP